MGFRREGASAFICKSIGSKLASDIAQCGLSKIKFSYDQIRKYLEESISNMGAVCKNSVSHYLKLKIK
jgi:hypothetical protein